MFSNVIVGWLTRRGLELGGIIATAITWYVSRSSAEQDAINRVFTGGWREVPVGIYFGIAATVWGYVWSFRSTIRPQVVTSSRQQLPLTPVGAKEAEAIAKLAPKPRTLADRLGEMFRR